MFILNETGPSHVTMNWIECTCVENNKGITWKPIKLINFFLNLRFLAFQSQFVLVFLALTLFSYFQSHNTELNKKKTLEN